MKKHKRIFKPPKMDEAIVKMWLGELDSILEAVSTKEFQERLVLSLIKKQLGNDLPKFKVNKDNNK